MIGPDLNHRYVAPHAFLHLPFPLLIEIQLVFCVVNLFRKLCQDGPKSAGGVVGVQIDWQT